MTALISPVARQLFLNPSNGAPASGFLLFTYAAGTETKQDTYVDSTGGTANTNPIVLDSLGECDLWLSQDAGYKFVFCYPTDTDPPTNPIWTVDNIFGSELTLPLSPWAIATGLPDAVTAAYTPPITSLPDGLLLGVRFGAANTTTTPTFRPDAQPIYAITALGGMPLAIGAISGANFEGLLRFNLPNTRWELLNPAPVSGAISGTAQLGPALNSKMSVTSASASATFTADSVPVATSLSGTAYQLTNYSQSINLATTGAGGMDTGSAPASGYVALYAIFNPTTTTASILACNVTTSSGTIYSGANLPAGYTASGLIGVLPTDSSSRFVPCYLSDRSVAIAPITYTSLTTGGGYTTLSLATAIPPTAKQVFGSVQATGTSPTGIRMGPVSGLATIGQVLIALTATGTSAATLNAQFMLPIITTQTIFYSGVTSSSGAVSVTGYSF